MHVLGRRLSIWWLLLFVPLLLVGLPLLGLLLIVAGHVGGAIIGPPAIWTVTRHSPPREDLVGHYKESERHWDRQSSGPKAVLELRSDGSLSVSALPNDMVASTCVVSGTGIWVGPDEDQKIDLVVTSDGAPGSCQSGHYSFLQLLGRGKPYGLYWVLGDPDSGTGIWFKEQ